MTAAAPWHVRFSLWVAEPERAALGFVRRVAVSKGIGATMHAPDVAGVVRVVTESGHLVEFRPRLPGMAADTVGLPVLP